MTHDIKKILNPAISKVEKIGQFFSPAAYINDTNQGIQQLERLIKEYKIGGLTFFHSRASTATNFEGKKTVVKNDHSIDRLSELITHYQSIAPYPLLISIDAEWGLAMRVENTPQYPYAITLGALPDEEQELIYEVGKHIGNDLKQIGIHLNLAPVVDINTNPNNPVIGYRSFGENKEKVIQKALTFYKGQKDANILGCFKHFPGHGDTEVDSHIGLPIISKSKEEMYDQELYPFIKAIEAGIDSILIGHLAIPSLTNGKSISATLSKEIIKGILRNELNFEGVVISDALNMHSVSKLYPEKGALEWKAFDAGNDLLCFAENVEEGMKTIEKNATSEQIEESFLRILTLKEKMFKGQSVKQNFNLEATRALNLKLAKGSLTAYKSNKENLNNFKTEGFETIMIGNVDTCSFIANIEKHIPCHTTNLNMLGHKNILIALFPPSIKPANNFGLDEEILKKINEISKSKNISLYLFGNPYVLRTLHTEYIENITIVYQNFDAFQEIASAHFLEQHTAIGKLPIILKK
ncbi:glycoside hydrolase family 3 N-terminal domain-containing protein [Aquimarina sp. 2201CG1-2-11]|uniref:glycoside hydrolase family 3 protein n=1 Tax=Aquimarina discodermiae TaxID=3231043 RepID=UPI003462D7ED